MGHIQLLEGVRQSGNVHNVDSYRDGIRPFLCQKRLRPAEKPPGILHDVIREEVLDGADIHNSLDRFRRSELHEIHSCLIFK